MSQFESNRFEQKVRSISLLLLSSHSPFVDIKMIIYNNIYIYNQYRIRSIPTKKLLLNTIHICNRITWETIQKKPLLLEYHNTYTFLLYSLLFSVYKLSFAGVHSGKSLDDMAIIALPKLANAHDGTDPVILLWSSSAAAATTVPLLDDVNDTKRVVAVNVDGNFLQVGQPAV